MMRPGERMNRRPSPPLPNEVPSPKEAVTCDPEDHARRTTRKKVISDEAFCRAASLFRAAGDVARLKLLDRLADGEWCVTELAEAAGVGLSTVSQQLRVLRSERIVERRRSGKHTFYSLADRHIIDVIENVLEHASEEREGPASDPPD
jgi:ArsR family transcriptional regulator, lead/cadmium/zinc/bismuth-responsive transcriptional repressor